MKSPFSSEGMLQPIENQSRYEAESVGGHQRDEVVL